MGFYTRQTVLLFALFDAQDRLSFLCFYTGETSRLWWASVLLLSDPRQSVHTVRVPYQPSVFAPFCFKSAGLALVWASAVLLWFLALLYTTKAELSIRRVYNKWDVLLHQKSKKLGYINCTKMWRWTRAAWPTLPLPWRCAGRCSTAARWAVPSSACCSAGAKSSERLY